MVYRKILLFSMLALLSVTAFSQSLFRGKETSVGININTRGNFIAGLYFKVAKLNSSKKMYHTFTLDLVNVKHPKEVKVISAISNRPFILAKQNYLFAIRPQFGIEPILFKKDPFEGIKVNGVLAGGPTLGLLKPYFITYQSGIGEEKTEPYDPEKHPDFNAITGHSGIFAGMNQARLVPGVNAKIGLIFEYGNTKNRISSLEVGFLAESYFKPINIIPTAFVEPELFISSAYIILSIGRKN